jgi:hypothetical protein
VGEMKDGQFHGVGTMYLTDGGKLDAVWENGKATDEVYTFADGLVYKEKDWDYCTEQDGRFYQERIRGFVPGILNYSNDFRRAPIEQWPNRSTNDPYTYT